MQDFRHSVITLLVAALTLAAFGSAGLQIWARDLPEGQIYDAIRIGAYAWHLTMDRFGLPGVQAELRQMVQSVRDGRW